LLYVPITTVQLPISVYLPAIYTQQYGLSLAALGAIFLAERIWGTATDPFVGWLCDRTRSRFGRRKVWIAAGSILYALSSWFLFFPGASVTPAYIAAALVVLFLSLSMIQIPYFAWSGQLSGDYHERTRITTYQTVAGAIGMFAVLVLPTLADHYFPGNQLAKLNGMGVAIVFPVIPLAMLALGVFSDRSEPQENRPAARVPLRAVGKAVLAEKVLLRLLVADFAIVFAQGARGAVFVFFVSFVAGMPQLASALFLFQFIFGIVAAPLWQAIARRIGKHRALFSAELGQAVVNFALIFVGKGDLALLAGLTVAQGLMQGSGNLLVRAMLADVADEHRLRTGQDRAALLFSAFSISGKAGVALPIGIMLPLIAWFGFDPAATANPPGGLLALALAFSFVPGLAHLIGAVLVRGFAIDEARLAEIRQALEQRDGHLDEKTHRAVGP
jgi:Na+/melibiose symporter-like transporter